MNKAYDLKALGEKLKAAGLPIAAEGAEEAGKAAYIAVKEWAKESAVLSENKMDDFAAAFYDKLDPIVLPILEKINPQG